MVVIGLENVLVLTKSVVSTPVDLEVKLRIAQGKFGECSLVMAYILCISLFFPDCCSVFSGLSNESWSIMKNMATELCIILIGYFTLVPAIQVRGQMLELLKEVHQEKTVVKVIVIK